MIHRFIKKYPQYELRQERELLPFVDGVDGSYVAQLRLVGDPPLPEE